MSNRSATSVLVRTPLTLEQRILCDSVAGRDGHFYAHTSLVEELIQAGYVRVRLDQPGQFVACLTPAAYFAMKEGA